MGQLQSCGRLSPETHAVYRVQVDAIIIAYQIYPESPSQAEAVFRLANCELLSGSQNPCKASVLYRRTHPPHRSPVAVAVQTRPIRLYGARGLLPEPFPESGSAVTPESFHVILAKGVDVKASREPAWVSRCDHRP